MKSLFLLLGLTLGVCFIVKADPNSGPYPVPGGGGVPATSLIPPQFTVGVNTNWVPINGIPLVLNGQNQYGQLEATNQTSVSYLTNQNQIKPDFTIAVQLMQTNAAFTFLPPVGIDATKLTMQTTAIYVTNSTAAAVVVTAPANCHPVGTMNVTNLTRFTFECYAQKFTNCFAVPIF